MPCLGLLLIGGIESLLSLGGAGQLEITSFSHFHKCCIAVHSAGLS